MKRKVVCAVLAVVMAGTMILSGCSGSRNEDSGAEKTETGSGTSEQEEEGSGEDRSEFSYSGEDVALNFMFITGGENEFYNETLPVQNVTLIGVFCCHTYVAVIHA